MAKIIWRRNEVELILANYNTKTTDELMKMLPGRSRKAINRKIEKLREEGRIGLRTQDTVNRAYRQRVRGAEESKPSRLGGRRLPVEGYEPVDDEEEEEEE